MKLMRIKLLAGLLLFLPGILVPLIHPRSVSAAVSTGKWLNAAFIQVDGKNYYDKSPWDGDMQFTNEENGCTSTVKVTSSGFDAADWTFQTRATGGTCGGSKVPITLTDVANSNIYFAFITPDKLVRVDSDNNWNFTRDGTTGNFLRDSEQGQDCQDIIQVSQQGAVNHGDLYEHKKADEGTSSGFPGCSFIAPNSYGEENPQGPVSFRIGDAGQIIAPPGGGNTGTVDPNGGKSCEDDAGDLGWILCAVIRATDSALSWVDERIQDMLQVDRNIYTNDGIHAGWSNIRNIAFVILVPMVLIMVMGTALNLDFVSAYTVKKALPRILAAVIFISLSYTICVFMIDLSNAVGKGTLSLLTSPFDFNQLPGVTQNHLTLASLFGGSASGGGGVFATLLASGAILVGGFVLIWLFMGTLLLLAGTAFLVLLLRQIFVVAFLLLAPLAILSWIFPGNEKLWKLWSGSFSKLLMMFPLIMGVIAVGRIFAFIIHQQPNVGPADNVLHPLMILGAYMIPYAFIPFTFKLAGGLFGTLTGMVNDKQKGLFDRQKATRARKTERTGRKVLQTRADLAGRAQSLGSRSRFVGAPMRFVGKRLGGYNVEAAMSARQAAVGKEINDQIATGRDDDVRGLTVDKSLLRDFRGAEARGLARTENGRRQYKSLGGAWIDEANVRAGHDKWGGDTFAQQAALSYEMRKASTEEEVQGLASRYAAVAQGSWGMTDRQAGGAWIGAAFENQNQHLEYKGTDWRTGQVGGGGAGRFVDEIYEKKGSYPLAQMSSNTVEQLKVAHREAVRTGDVDRQNKIRAITETFMHEYGSGGVPGAPPDEGGETAPGAGGRRQASTPGAAHVAERVRELAVMTGVYAAAPTGPHLPPGVQGPGGVTPPNTHAGTPTQNQQDQK